MTNWRRDTIGDNLLSPCSFHLLYPPNPPKGGLYRIIYDIEKCGIKILRFANEQVFNDISLVINKIIEVLSSLAPLQGGWGVNIEGKKNG
jgi:hypothetical protein